MRLIEKAIQLTVQQHAGQNDKSGVPYLYHPIRCMIAAQALGLDEEHQSVAVLHDIVEDTRVTLTDISPLFPENVIEGLDAMTRRSGKNAMRIDGIPVDETYVAFTNRAAQNAIARKVKLLDNADNMRPERRLSDDFKLPKRYVKAYRTLINANAIAGDMDFVIRFRRLHPWVAKLQ